MADNPVSDTIELRGLRVVGVVGVLAEERERAQPLEIDLDVDVDLTAAGVSDDLSDSVDYGELCDVVVATVAGPGAERPELLERLAASIADAVLDRDDRIGAVTVSVRKLRPPVPHDLSTSGVRVRRHRRSRTSTIGFSR